MNLDVSLDPTLGCGQAHRWIKNNDTWEGVIGDSIVRLREDSNGISYEGTDKKTILEYFRHGDDLSAIYEEISSKDLFVSKLAEACPGMRILKQDGWECIATYILATNANVKRIGAMIDAVCRQYGRDIGGRHSFPTPKMIVESDEDIAFCKLGYRESRFLELARMVADRELEPEKLEKMDYSDCVETLKTVKGIGNKVADCIALFAFGHLNAFPIDARIEKCLSENYGICGNYAKISEFSRAKFGRYAGYAQELLYHSSSILLSQAHAGGSHPI